MKWELKEPAFGDIIKVKAGTIYHYGIYVSDDEVIQFGLSPALRQNLSSEKIEVCASHIDQFLLGEFLEVGVLEKKDKKRFSPQKTVETARMRLGETGYDIIHNNCEHFAYECFGWGKKSFQADGVREMFRKMSFVDVYFAELPKSDKIRKVYPPLRQKEISTIKNKAVKKEKYFVWKLLEYALETSYGKKIKDIRFEKSETGKWRCDQCEFSLSHSKEAVCVAISQTPVGVDIEKIQRPKIDFSAKILSIQEQLEYRAICEENDKHTYLISAWTKKESLFKVKNVKTMSLEEFKNQEGNVFHKIVCCTDGSYSLSVATSNPEKIRLREGIDLSKV